MDRGLLAACIISLAIFAIPTTILSVLWSTNQQALWTFSSYGKATSVAMSSDGSYIAVGLQTSYNPTTGQVVLLNKAGTVLWAHNSSTITSVAISPDGSRIAASGLVTRTNLQMIGTVYYFDQSGNQLWTYSTGLHYVNSPSGWAPPQFKVMLSDNGSRIVVDTGTGAVVVDDLGRLLWSYTPNCSYTVCPWLTLASAKASIVVTVTNETHAFDSNGVSLWNSSSVPQPNLVNGVMSRDGKFLLLEWENMFSLNPTPTLTLLDNSGVELWNRTLSGITAVLAISSDDSAIVMSPGGRVAAISPQNRALWNSTQAPGYLMVTTSHNSYTAATLGLGLGNNVLRILDSSGRTMWGYGNFGEVDAMALSSDDSFLAVAAGPYSTFSGNSASIVFLRGPQALSTDRGPTYAWFTFDPNAQDRPWLFVVPALLAPVPLLYLLRTKRRMSHQQGQRVAGQQPVTPPASPS